MSDIPQPEETVAPVAQADPGHPVVEHHDSSHQLWPEEVRDKPRVDRFPWPTMIVAALPGLCAIMILLVPLVLLLQQSRQQIVFNTPEGALSMVRANGSGLQMMRESTLQLDSAARAQLDENLPVLGLPTWSPDGSKLATTVVVNQAIQPMVLMPMSGTTVLLSSIVDGGNQLVTPGSGWSPDGSHLALLESDGQRAFVTFVNLAEEEPVMIPVKLLPLDTRAGMSWHPAGERLLVTAGFESAAPLTLQHISTNGVSSEFDPDDGSAIRVDGVWSPDGQAIVYVVPDGAHMEQSQQLAGALWMAAADGGAARPLVAEGLNMAPVWDRSDPNRIYFTRLLTETNSLELFWVNAFGAPQVQQVGDNSEPLVAYPFDRQHFLQRSESSQTLTVTDTPVVAASRQGMTIDALFRMMLSQSLPVLGTSQWSPDGRRLLTTAWENGKIQPALYGANLQQQWVFGSGNNVVAAPADGWSDDGQALALVESDGERALLSLHFLEADKTVPFDFTLDPRAGMDWQPTDRALLVTGYSDERPVPTLFIVTEEGVSELVLNDGQLVHGDGVWSPDGERVAYIASNEYTVTQEMLAGSLWVVENGQSRNLTNHQALAPMWNPVGDMIYYTRFLPETGQFDFYRVAVDGSSPPEYIAPGSESLVLYPWDRTLQVQWSPDSEQLTFLGAEQPAPVAYLPQAPSEDSLNEIRSRLPVAGAARWSDDQAHFVGTVINEGNVRVALFKSPDGPPILTPTTEDWIVTLGDGWSPAETYVAVLRHNGSQAQLALLDLIQSSLSPAILDVDMRAGISWHPSGSLLMLTAFEGEERTPTVKLVQVGEQLNVQDFTPADGLSVRADAVWSPDGRQIVYVAPPSITATREMDFLAGALWLEPGDGTLPRPLVEEGLNFAPIWDPGQERILFTRFMTETERFELYQVDLVDGEIVHLGGSSAAIAEFPFDRKLILNWSPDGRRWLLPGAREGAPLWLYQARISETGIDARLLSTQCASSALPVSQWSPTNRALLLACPSSEMFLHWVDRQRDDTAFPEGLYPTWQP